MNKCKACQATIEGGHYCAMCLSIAHCQEQVQSGYQAFLETLPAYEDEIEKIMQRIARFAIPADKLAQFQASCEHHYPVELRKGDDTHAVICTTCGLDMFPF